jgi:hypothetical protein
MLFRNADLARLAGVKAPNLYRDYELPHRDDYLVGTKAHPEGAPVYCEATVIAWCAANDLAYDLGRMMK